MSDPISPRIKNFRKINDWLFCGGQPSLEQIDELKLLGIKTILCLRWNPRVIVDERIRAQQADIEFYSIPLNYVLYPTRNEERILFDLLDNESCHPVFIHCKHGCDRTGMFLAFFRIAREGWTAAQAYEEMVRNGHHRVRMHHFKWAVYRFAATHSSSHAQK